MRSDNLLPEIAERERWAQVVRAIRAKRGWTQARLAHFLGISVKTVSSWERCVNTPHGTYQGDLKALEEMT